MRIPPAAGLCAILISPALAQTPTDLPAAPTEIPSQQAPRAPEKRPSLRSGQWLLDAFGPAGMEALRARGYVVVQGREGEYRLQKVQWKALDALSRRTKSIQEFSAAAQRLKSGQALAPAGPLPFLSLGELPPSSLMTPPLHALLEAMAAYHEEWTALAGPQDEAAAAPVLPTLAGPNLFDTAWGKAFAGRTHAELMADPLPLVNPYFETFLAGARSAPGAAAHFMGYMRDRYQVDVSSRLAADARAGLASEELRLWLRRCLGDQRRFHALGRIRREAASLEKRTALSQDLLSLESVASVFRDRPGLIAELEGVVQAAPPADGAHPPFPEAAPELTSSGLHLEKPVALGQHEPGDAVVVSGAYWVDGLAAGRTMEIEQTTYRETAEGISDAQVQTFRRGNGGPYAFARRIALEDSSPFVFHAVISAPSGNTLDESIPVPVAKDFDLALLRLAAADNQSMTCAFKEAESSYAALEESIADAALEKPQYRDLLNIARKRRSEAVKNAARQALFDAAAAEAKSDSEPELCRYDLKRTEAALSLAKALPAGCDRYLADLRRQRRLIARRAAAQQAFASNCALAAARRRSCNFGPAADAWAQALAILDADPAARCGKTAEAARQAEASLLGARADELWREAAAEDLRRAKDEDAPAKRLPLIETLIARIGTLSDPSCFAAELDRAEKLAQDAGEAMAPPDALAAKLPEDAGVAGAVREVAAQRRTLIKEAATLQTKQAAEQAPAGMGQPSLKGGSSPSPERAAGMGQPSSQAPAKGTSKNKAKAAPQEAAP